MRPAPAPTPSRGQLNIPQDGTYTLYAKYPAATGAATSAKYTVKHAAGRGQDGQPDHQAGTWVSLGTYTFTDGNTGKVTLAQCRRRHRSIADADQAVRDNTGDTDTENTGLHSTATTSTAT